MSFSDCSWVRGDNGVGAEAMPSISIKTATRIGSMAIGMLLVRSLLADKIFCWIPWHRLNDVDTYWQTFLAENDGICWREWMHSINLWRSEGSKIIRNLMTTLITILTTDDEEEEITEESSSDVKLRQK